MLSGVQQEGRAGFAVFEPAWAVALCYADALEGSGHGVSDTLYADLAAHWTPEQIVEITMVIGLFAYFNRFNNALQVEVTR